jgi:ABC-type spermidine/putrescine transport system permease subunit I
MHGPFDAQVKSLLAFAVMLPVPMDAVVRTLYWIVMEPV